MKILAMALFAVAAAFAEDYCSLIVEVVNSNGQPVSGQTVEVFERDGRAVSAVTTNGEARFCDLGVLPVTIRVIAGYDQPSVENTLLSWMQTRKVRITYDDTRRRPVQDWLCSILLRFRDEEGKWIPDVALNPSLPKSPNLRSDSFGRAMLHLDYTEEVHVTSEHAGYVSEKIDTVKCTSFWPESERIVTLRRSVSVAR
jgi:hypothetical protein